MSVIFNLFPADGLILLWAQVQIEALEGIWNSGPGEKLAESLVSPPVLMVLLCFLLVLL